MSALAGPLIVACLLLVVAGVAKIHRPGATAAAAAALGLPSNAVLVRGLGVGELAVAVATMAFGGWWPVVVGAVYSGFAAFIVVAVRRGVESCGCLGQRSASPRHAHAALDAVLAVCAFAAVGIEPLPQVLADLSWRSAPLLVAVGATGGAALRLLAANGAVLPAAGVNRLPGQLHSTEIAGRTIHDEPVAIGLGGLDHPTLLAFLSTNCLTCRHFWVTFAEGFDPPDPAIELVIITKDADVENRTALRRLAPKRTRVIMSSQAWHDLDIAGSPAFLLVDGPSGSVSVRVIAESWPEVRAAIAGARTCDEQRSP